MKYNGSFNDSKNKLIDQAQRALFALYTKIRNLNLPLDIQVSLFDSLVEPILLYGSEIWGYENNEKIERVHLQFCKRILGLRKSTPNFMVYGELGRYPLDINIKIRMISFYNRMIKDRNKLSSIMFRLIHNLHLNNICTFKWISYVKSIFDDCGLSYVYDNQQYIDISLLKPVIKQTLRDQFIQKWFKTIDDSSRGNFYSLFKVQFGMEKYLLNLKNNSRIWISKLRCCNINIPLEKGRWYNIPKEDRLCTFCNEHLIGDEYHYFFICKSPNMTNLRQRFIPSYYTQYPSIEKMKYMLLYCNKKLLFNIAMFIKQLCSLL